MTKALDRVNRAVIALRKAIDAAPYGELREHYDANYLIALAGDLRDFEQGRYARGCSEMPALPPALPPTDGLTSTETCFLRQNKKILAIKAYRDRTRVGLAEAKDIVERWIAANGGNVISRGRRREAPRRLFACECRKPPPEAGRALSWRMQNRKFAIDRGTNEHRSH